MRTVLLELALHSECSSDKQLPSKLRNVGIWGSRKRFLHWSLVLALLIV